MSLYDDVRLMASFLGEGTHNGLVCPKCRGGLSEDKAFTLTKTHSHIKFICYRATCGFSGIVDHRSGKVITQQAKVKATTNPFTGVYESYPEKVAKFLEASFGINNTQVKWAVESKRVLFPVRNFQTKLGFVARGYKELGWNGHGPKTISYIDTDTNPFLHIPKRAMKSSTITIVEDWVSAEVVASFTQACAILGTHLSMDAAVYLRANGVEHIKLAFDSNAWHKYPSVMQRCGALFKSVTGMTWESGLDPKDMEYGELIENFT